MSLKDVTAIDKLGAHNYATWSTDVKWALIMKGLWNAIDDPEQVEEGEDAKALAFIGLTVEKYIKSSIDGCDTAREAWDKLEHAYKASATALRIKLKRELATIQYGWMDVRRDGTGGTATTHRESVTSYVARASAIRDQLAAAGVETSAEEFAMAVLSGLPDEYTAMVDNLVTSAGALDVEEVLPKLLMIEQRLKDKYDQEKAKECEVALSARASSATCWKCGAKGHLRRDCPERNNGPDELIGKRVYVPPKKKFSRSQALSAMWVTPL